MSGITGIYNVVPRLRAIISRTPILSSGGANPVDTTVITLPNVRGQVSVSIVASDTGQSSTFEVVGGFGAWPGEPTLDWYYTVNTAIGCTVTTLLKNRLQIETPVTDAGGRVYVMNFSPLAGFGPNITQTSVNVLGAANLTVTLSKVVFAGGY